MAGMFCNDSIEEIDKREDNLVEYYIFSTKTDVTSDIFVNEVFAFLSTKCHLGKYIWHCDSFNLKSYSETRKYLNFHVFLRLFKYSSTYR